MSAKRRPHKKSQNRRSGRGNHDKIVRSPQGVDQKISEILLDFIEPYRQFANTDKALERLVAIGITAWNVSLFPEEQREEKLSQIAAVVVVDGQSLIRRLVLKIRVLVFGQSQEVDDFKQIVYELVDRKLQHYAAIRRFIVHYEFTQTDDDIHLLVMSTLSPIGKI